MADRAKAMLSMHLCHGDKTVGSGRLGALCGTNPRGETYGFTSYYMTQNGKPWIPVVGEFHYSRFSYLY